MSVEEDYPPEFLQYIKEVLEDIGPPPVADPGFIEWWWTAKHRRASVRNGEWVFAPQRFWHHRRTRMAGK